VSDTSVSVSTPAHIHAVPPRSSTAGFWGSTSLPNNALFTMIAPSGSIIDISLDLILQDEDTVEEAAFTRAIASGTLGNMYYLALDNATGHTYVPVSLTTTF
jgi:hypothetical protein